MALKRSQNRSKRERLDEARAKLRATFQAPAKKEKQAAAPPAEVLAAAWDLAADIEGFVRRYLPHYMVDQDTGAPVEPAEFHRELYQLALSVRLAAIGAPREHAKSTVISLFFVLYCICHKLRRFIVLISDTEAQAILLLGAAKAELETNDKLRADFGDLVNIDKWGEKDILTTTGIRLAARGAGQSLRGLRQRQFRPDLVVLDDVENDEAVDSPERREKLLVWFKRAVMNLGKTCQVFVVGTILHYDSLLAKLLGDEEFPTFTKRLYIAVDDDWSQESVLWPQKWPIEALRAKEQDIGIVDFDQEYRNRPINQATQVFREEWFKQHQFTWETIKGARLDKVLGIDPAISLKQKADFFGSVTIGIDRSGFILVTRAEQKKIPFPDQVKHICERHDAEKPAAIGIESVAYQRSLKQRLDEVSRETRRYMTIVEVEAPGDKFARISTLAPLVENGTIRFCLDGSQAVLIKQLLFLGKIKDDVADALEIAVRVARELRWGVSTDHVASGTYQAHAAASAYAS